MSNTEQNSGSNEQHDTDQQSLKTLAEAVRRAIGDNKGDSRFIDLKRIPLICLSMANMSKALDEIKAMMKSDKDESDRAHENFVTKESLEQQISPLRNVVYGGVGFVLLAVAGAMVAMVIK